jgi:hypothetical protein
MEEMYVNKTLTLTWLNYGLGLSEKQEIDRGQLTIASCFRKIK